MVKLTKNNGLLCRACS